MMENKNNDNEDLFRIQIRSFVDYRNDNDKAIMDYDKAIQLNPNDADAYKYRGLAYFIKGDYDQAIADFTQIVQLKPTDDNACSNRNTAYHNRGITYIYKDKYDLAVNDFNQILKNNQNDIYELYSRGFAYYCIGDFDKAIADWEVVEGIDPCYQNVKQNLEIARKKIGE
jgi:tetratricopeptide (TPR) repeat protein